MAYTKGKCGCNVTILKFSSLEHPVKWRINYCHIHKAAEDMYEALETTLKNLEDGFANKNLSLKTMISKALAKAEG